MGDGMSVPPEESSSPEQCLSKLIALIRSVCYTVEPQNVDTFGTSEKCPD